MNKLTLSLTALIIIAFSSFSVFAQESTINNKQSLIVDFRKLTGADKVTLSVNVSTDIRENLTLLIDQEKEISDEQKQELKKFINAANERVDKTAKDFLANQQTMTKLSEEIIYQTYDKTFTVSELKELIAFYQTPTGQKAAAFLPALSKQIEKAFTDSVVAKLQAIVIPKIQEEETQLKQMLKDIKNNKQ